MKSVLFEEKKVEKKILEVKFGFYKQEKLFEQWLVHPFCRILRSWIMKPRILWHHGENIYRALRYLMRNFASIIIAVECCLFFGENLSFFGRSFSAVQIFAFFFLHSSPYSIRFYPTNCTVSCCLRRKKMKNELAGGIKNWWVGP